MRQRWPDTAPEPPLRARALRLIRRHPTACLLWLIVLLLPVWWWLSSGDAKLTPTWVCAQPIPHSTQSLFLIRFESEWAFTEEHWSYLIGETASHSSVDDIKRFPRGRVFEVTNDGTVQLASFAAYDPKLGERTTRSVIRGVPVVETVFNAENSSWGGGSYTFENVAAEGDRVVFTAVRDGLGKPLHERLLVDPGGIVANDQDGVIRYLEVYRIEPEPGHSPVGTPRRLLHETYTPRAGLSIRLDRVPARGICKRSPALNHRWASERG